MLIDPRKTEKRLENDDGDGSSFDSVVIPVIRYSVNHNEKLQTFTLEKREQDYLKHTKTTKLRLKNRNKCTKKRTKHEFVREKKILFECKMLPSMQIYLFYSMTYTF